MTVKLPTTSYAVLGLLAFRPMSGYELARFVSGSIAHFWPISKSQVYGELTRLEEIGHLAGTAVSQERRPDKRTFEVTRAGQAALDSWLDTPAPLDERNRIPMLVKVFFADRMAPARLTELLEQARSRAESERDEYDGIVAALAAHPALAQQRATALYGLRHAEATLGWLEEVGAEPGAQRAVSPPSTTITPPTTEPASSEAR